jgi:hypothetical protein
VIISSGIVAFAVVYLLRTGIRYGFTLFRQLMYIAMVFLILALIVAWRQSAVDWKDQPEKRRPLRVLFSLIVFMIAVMIPVAFVFFG